MGVGGNWVQFVAPRLFRWQSSPLVSLPTTRLSLPPLCLHCAACVYVPVRGHMLAWLFMGRVLMST